jgi:Domain of unknown function (DUF5618)
MEAQTEVKPYQEAIRYMKNAKQILQQAGKDGREYIDVKYVQVASGTAYLAVLLAIDEYLRRKEGLKFVKPQSIEEYRKRLMAQNKSLKTLLNEVYGALHILGYYHGTTSVKMIKDGFDDAYKIIEYIK